MRFLLKHGVNLPDLLVVRRNDTDRQGGTILENLFMGILLYTGMATVFVQKFMYPTSLFVKITKADVMGLMLKGHAPSGKLSELLSGNMREEMIECLL